MDTIFYAYKQKYMSAAFYMCVWICLYKYTMQMRFYARYAKLFLHLKIYPYHLP